jgi:hypothetical protein
MPMQLARGYDVPGVQVPEQDVLGDRYKRVQLSEILKQGQYRDSAEAEKQKLIQRGERVRSIIAANGGDIEKSIAPVMQVDPEIGLELKTQFEATQKQKNAEAIARDTQTRLNQKEMQDTYEKAQAAKLAEAKQQLAEQTEMERVARENRNQMRLENPIPAEVQEFNSDLPGILAASGIDPATATPQQKWEAKQTWLEKKRGPQGAGALPSSPAGFLRVMNDPASTPEQKAAAKASLDGLRAYEMSTRPASAVASESAKEEMAQSLARGDMTRIRDVVSLRSSGGGGTALEIFNRARQINPKFSTAEIERKIAMESDLMKSTPGSIGGQLQSFGTFLEHAGAASEAINVIRQTSSPLANRPLNWWKENASGDPNYQAFMVSLEPVRKEFEGFLLGGRALYGDDRVQAQKILSDNSSPAQVQAALKQMGHTAKARFNEINFRYKRQMNHDIEDPFPPEAVEAAKKIGVDLRIMGAASQVGQSAIPPASPVNRPPLSSFEVDKVKR